VLHVLLTEAVGDRTQLAVQYRPEFAFHDDAPRGLVSTPHDSARSGRELFLHHPLTSSLK
jgi:hypothetical protein